MLSVRQTSAALGAEVEGVDLSLPLTDATVAEIDRLWLEHEVIFFRGQKLAPEALRDHLKSEITRWSAVIKSAGIKPEERSFSAHTPLKGYPWHRTRPNPIAQKSAPSPPPSTAAGQPA